MTNKLRNIFGLLIGLIFCSGLSAQDKTTDSLKQALKTAKHDTTRCNILNELIEAESDDKIWPIYNEQLLKLAEKGAASSSTPTTTFYLIHLAGALNNVGYLASLQGDIPKALEYYHRSLKIKEEIKDKSGIAYSLQIIGLIYKIYILEHLNDLNSA